MTEFVPYVEHHLEILPFLPGKGEKRIFFGKMETFVTSSRYAPQQIYVCLWAHTHDVHSDSGGADDYPLTPANV